MNDAALQAGGMFTLFQELSMHGAPIPNGGYLPLPSWVRYEPDAPLDDPFCPLGKQRTLLQFWGTQYRRYACDKFYWVRALKAAVEAANPHVALVPDLRFVNEYQWVKANGGFTIRCERIGFSDLDVNTTHTSEHELDGVIFDYTITVGEGELDVLKEDAVTVFGMIVKSLSVPEEQESAYAAA